MQNIEEEKALTERNIDETSILIYHYILRNLGSGVSDSGQYCLEQQNNHGG